MPVVKLNDDFIKTSLTCPTGRRIEYCDRSIPGLYVEVRSTSEGQGTFYLRYKSESGKTCHQKIGRTIDVDLTEARDRAKKLRAEIALGADLREVARARKELPTVSDYMEKTYLPRKKTRLRSWRNLERVWRLHLKPVFGDRKLDKVRREEVENLLIRLHDSGLRPATANHVIKALKNMYNECIADEYVTTNAAARVKLLPENNQIQRRLSAEELGRLMEVLNTYQNRTPSLMAIMLLATGSRFGEVRLARWEDINKDERVWKIPATVTKNRKTRIVALSDTAMDVLRQLKTEGKSEYLFVNRKTKKPYTTISKTWERIRAKAGLPDLRIHDLRHAWASAAVSAGHSLYVVQQALSHASPQTTMRYARLAPETIRAATDSVSELIKGAGGGKDG